MYYLLNYVSGFAHFKTGQAEEFMPGGILVRRILNFMAGGHDNCGGTRSGCHKKNPFIKAPTGSIRGSELPLSLQFAEKIRTEEGPSKFVGCICIGEMAEVEGCKSEQRQKQRRAVVAVDESEESMYALSWALQYLLHKDSKEDHVILLHAQSPPRVYAAVDGTAYVFSSDIMESLEKQQRENTESILERAGAICNEKNICFETVVETGDARDVICEQVEKLQADILIIGSHGYGTIKRTFLGSVSDYCVRHAKCPVVIVKLPKD